VMRPAYREPCRTSGSSGPLKGRGAAAVLHSGPMVDHELPLSLREACLTFYRSARVSAAAPEPGDVARTLLLALWEIVCAPANAVRTALRVAVHKGRFRVVAVGSVPAVFLLIVAHNVGVAVSAIGGPGNAAGVLH
jgi:hypothetical protein